MRQAATRHLRRDAANPMPPTPDVVDAQFEVAVGAFGSSEIRVALFKGREEMSALYRFDVHFRRLGGGDDTLEEDLLHQPARLVIRSADGVTSPVVRGVDGIVTQVASSGVHMQGGATGTFRISPRMARLCSNKNSRVYQDMTVNEIVAKLLRRHHVEHRFDTRKGYPKRAYCTQYQESDYTFVARLLAEDGIFFYFEQPPLSVSDPLADFSSQVPTETVVFADQDSAYVPIAGNPVLQYGQGEQGISTFEVRRRVSPDSLVIRTCNYLNPRADPDSYSYDTSAVAGIDPTRTQIHEHHAEYETPDVARNVTPVQLEQHRRGSYRGWGTSDCRRLTPGHTFLLDGHEVAHLDGHYAVTKVEHEAHSSWVHHDGIPDYIAIFHCVHQSIAFRPARPERPPREVLLTGVVVGPEGQDVHTDELGRIKVQLHWDRHGRNDAGSSCFLRVATPWAGPGFGVQLVPRVGMEVLVGFIGGDLDNPVVVGCLYNRPQPPPFHAGFAGRRNGIVTRSSPGGTGYNELSFDDTAGSEQVRLRAERDFEIHVGGSASCHVAHNSVRTVSGYLSDKTLGEQIVEVHGNQVNRALANQTLYVERDRRDTVRGSVDVTVGKKLTSNIGGDEERTVAGDSDLEISGQRTERIRGGSTTVVAGDRPVMHQIHVQGTSQISASERLASEAGEQITFSCGKSVLRLLPDAIELISPEIRLVGPNAQVRLREGQIELRAKATIDVRAQKTMVRSSGARLLLGEDAKLEGKKIKLNCEREPDDEVFPAHQDRATHIELEDQKGRPLGHRHYTVLSGDDPVTGGILGKNGTDDVVLEDGDQITFSHLGAVRKLA